MFKNIITTQRKRIGNMGLVTGFLLLVCAFPVSAEYYIGVDASKIYESTVFGNGTTKMNMNTTRVKLGRRFQEFGWELQMFAPTDGTGYFENSLILDRLDINGGLGAHLTVATPGRGLYGSLGITFMSTEYQELTGPYVGIVDKGNEIYLTYTLGGQYKFNKNFGLTLEYAFYQGNYNCSTCVGGPNRSNPEIRLSTINLGISYSF